MSPTQRFPVTSTTQLTHAPNRAPDVPAPDRVRLRKVDLRRRSSPTDPPARRYPHPAVVRRHAARREALTTFLEERISCVQNESLHPLLSVLAPKTSPTLN